MTDNANETQDETAEVLAKYPAPWTAQHTTGSLAVIKDGNGGLILCTFETFARLIVDAVNYRATRERLGCWGEAEADLKLIEELAELRGHADHRDEQVRILQAERDSARAELEKSLEDARTWEKRYSIARKQRDESDELANKHQMERDSARAELEEAKAHLEQYMGMYRESDKLLGSTLVMCNTAQSALAQARARVAELEAADRWIPVGEAVPEDEKPVLIIVDLAEDGYQDCVLAKRRSCGCWYDDWAGEHIVSSPTHWRPLPAPPDKAGKEA